MCFLPHQDVIGLVASSDRKRIAGVCVREHGQLAGRTTIAADLIVDASGHSSKLPYWLQELGYFDPIYGQGMSVAAMEAETLARCLHERQSSPHPGFERHVLGRMQEAIAPAWWLSSVSDLNTPGVTYTGSSPLRGVRLIQVYRDLYLKYGPVLDRELIQKGMQGQTYMLKNFLMNGLLISPCEVINARVLATLLAVG